MRLSTIFSDRLAGSLGILDSRVFCVPRIFGEEE